MKQRKLSRQNHSGCGICKYVFVGLEERGGGKESVTGVRKWWQRYLCLSRGGAEIKQIWEAVD